MRLIILNIHYSVDETKLRYFLEQKGIVPTSLVFKEGFAFLQCSHEDGLKALALGKDRTRNMLGGIHLNIRKPRPK